MNPTKNLNFKRFFILVAFLILTACTEETKPGQNGFGMASEDTIATTTGDELSLAGLWRVKLDSLDQGKQNNWFAEAFKGQAIDLPGTLDDAGIGIKDTLTPALNNYVLSNLARKHAYIGKAWYQKQIEVPQNWSNQDKILSLERVLWSSTLYVDSLQVGSEESLVGSHKYDLSEILTPGKHLITVVIDNSNLYPQINVKGDKYPLEVNQDMAHAYTNHTQIKWNGMLGDLKISASPKNKPESLKLYPDDLNDAIQVVYQHRDVEVKSVRLEISDASGKSLFDETIERPVVEGEYVHFSIQRPEGLAPWDEFNQNLYQVKLTSGDSQISQTYGHRVLEARDGDLVLNGKRIFLRGNLECVIFPLTGHPPMEVEEWAKLYEQAKNYGLNHIRFHSWCPPEAAFAAADEVGMYLQVELPHWSLTVGEDAQTTAFLKEEAQKILKEYGHHPSFLFFSMGNELQGNFDVLNAMVKELKAEDSRHLYATTSFSFQKPAGILPQPEDEVFIAQWTDKGWIRGQGVFNHKYPSFDEDFSANSAHIDVPLVSHEIGQYSVYPDMSEIEDYTGVLMPLNFIAVRNDLEQKGMLDKAKDFTYVSGKLATMLYKEEIERALKTPSFDGFQLLQLQDFPGQGTALVGILNAFWESKGVVSGEEFREFNSPLVPLARFKKAVYESGETFKAGIEIANFLEEKTNQKIKISLKDDDGKPLLEKVLENIDLKIGNNINLGSIEFPVNVDQAEAWSLEISLLDSNYKNHWPLWVYPKSGVEISNDAIVETRSFEKAIRLLKEGKTVLLNPDYKELKGVTGRFVPVFWSPVHFPDQPATMGLLIQKNHPALALFPTEKYTQWQWWDLCKQSTSVNLGDLEIDPIVGVVDNFVTNRKLGDVFEARIGSGKLIFSSMDISNNLEKRPAARQLRSSLLRYMESDSFKPEITLTESQLQSLKK
ncbi:sugar-binding domain-containing protein [Leeuwenhoekiella parthenopeia]|uniref:Glycoside hydrolase family 2 n=1 Tax=Leeuwenhoekiella parthenopeia TaxID=2890320 RepID=A0ABS8GMU3_9FLAO|nr:sugar-binding domain-containing protein [Leeuwenhoekiella parthenopeia]MCC4211235.1 glycoside hydrolase family 2 [Leeuwenhoekiella parthenopeia]